MKTAFFILLAGLGVAATLFFLLSQPERIAQEQHMMAPQFSSEREFIEHMIPHHEEAIRTAQEVLDRGATTEGMISLAENIIRTQKEEVDLMRTKYEEWHGVTYEDTGVYVPMMRDLSSLSGKDLDAAFLHDMTMHHMGAIMMAQTVLPIAEHEEIETLANAIIVNQSAEIQVMRELYREIMQNKVTTTESKNIFATIFKSATCGCCLEYAEHLIDRGYTVHTENTEELIAIKERFGVPAQLGSCHTMVIDGYVVEGHVPEEAVQKLLTERPPIKGIGMAGMPSGSPGMPGPKEEFAIYEINLDGTKGDLFMLL